MPPKDWEDEAISKIMLVTLDVCLPCFARENIKTLANEQREKAQLDSDYIFLQTVLNDLAEQGERTFSA